MGYPIFHSQYTAAQIEAAIGKGPRVNTDGYWEVWNVGTGAYESTGVGAGVQPPTVVTQVSQMTNHGYIYIYNGSESGYTAGYWYYWDGSAWTAGGAYQVAATDTTLTVAGAAADAKATGDAVGELKSALKLGTGTYSVNADLYTSNPVLARNTFANVKRGTVFRIFSPSDVLGFAVLIDGSTVRSWSKSDYIADDDYDSIILSARKSDSTSIASIVDECGYILKTDIALDQRAVLPTNTDLDTLMSNAKYQILSSNTYLHSPMASITAELYIYSYIVPSNNTTVVTQVITRPSSTAPIIFTRTKFGSNAWSSWGEIATENPFSSEALYPSSFDLNDITTAGVYTVYSSGTYSNFPPISVTSGILEVSVDDRGAIWQKLTVNSTGVIYTRNKVTTSWGSWHFVDAGNGLNILLLGDSIFGNDGQIASFIGEKSASCINGAFGGTRVTVRDTGDFQYFDGVNIVTALTTQDWTEQDTASTSLAPDYPWITQRLTDLKAVDMSEIDVIIMDWGTNDYTASKTIAEIVSAYNSVIDMLQTTYPTIRLLITTPIWRYWGTKEDNLNGDTRVYNVSTLKEIALAIEQNAKDKRISVFNAYQNIPLSYATASTFYDSGDTTHLNIYGNEVYAGYLLGKLRTMF